MLVEGFQCILGTGGMEPALASEKRSQGCLVGKHPKPQTPNANPTTHDRRPSNACRASCKDLAYSVINMGWCERTFTTTSTPSGHSCCCKRKLREDTGEFGYERQHCQLFWGELRPSLGPVSREVWRANTNRGPPDVSVCWHTPNQIPPDFGDAVEADAGRFVSPLFFLVRSTVVPHHRQPTGQTHHRLRNRFHDGRV